MEPKVILVDLQDNPLGELEKSAAHRAPRLHRAFSIFLYNGSKVLLQRRALDKYHCGGLWANTCCSHPIPGKELLLCASNRLLEETGIVHKGLLHLREFPYFARFHQDLYEYEYDHVFVGEYDGPVAPNRQEVEEMRWVEIPHLLQDMVSDPTKYTPWFLICAPKTLQLILSLHEL